MTHLDLPAASAGGTATSAMGSAPLRHAADPVRVLAMDAVQHASSGHPGMPMGMADAAAVL